MIWFHTCHVKYQSSSRSSLSLVIYLQNTIPFRSLVQDSTIRIYSIEFLHTFSFTYFAGVVGMKIKEIWSFLSFTTKKELKENIMRSDYTCQSRIIIHNWKDYPLRMHICLYVAEVQVSGAGGTWSICGVKKLEGKLEGKACLWHELLLIFLNSC